MGRVQFVVFWSFKKFTNVHSFQIAREKPCDNVLIIYMKKYDIAYHNYAEAKRTHQEKL